MNDLISRQTALEIIRNLYPSEPFMPMNRKRWKEKYKPYIECEKALERLPSAQAERPKGKWIPHKSIFGGLGERVYTCNRCGYNIGFHTENFCPECGSRMRGK